MLEHRARNAYFSPRYDGTLREVRASNLGRFLIMFALRFYHLTKSIFHVGIGPNHMLSKAQKLTEKN